MSDTPMLIEVPFFVIPREEDGRTSREFQRLHELGMRWHPEVTVPKGMESAAGRKRDEVEHAGITALGSLRMGNEISRRQLVAALDYLDQAIDYYGFALEPYQGRNEEAVRNLRELREALV